ncbi:ubiquitin carboxyl-terminal hydrolase 32-like isoform X1 [Dreissena polymorpha]|uniref:ubiquitin carboxyl-terminal hydrolase 32-like isoform X1 n=1 Tax=Dreissena polymorpha TaxID=45954 RepID=UPI002264F3BB|nr:ubiquitin carboxyl-terminal hydrolase 32-like isoform X1 [Dreissena polymorpha]
MGGKDSKLSYITHEEALKRVSDAELKRLKDAFKRFSVLGGFITENVFCREVLWDSVPQKVAQLLFKGFGGTSKGISFKDLLAGMVVLTKGTKEEKIKLIFAMYADDSYSLIQKDDMDRKIVATEDQVPDALSHLFAEGDQVSYERFRRWVYSNPEATIITKWLLTETMAFTLSDDTETPTFYQTLAGVTHLEEADIIDLERKYWNLKAQSKTGKFDQETFKSFVYPTIPESLCEALFMAFDENLDNHIDFKEIACGVSACCRGPLMERQKFCFKIFDTKHDNKLDEGELREMVDALVAIRMDNKAPDELESDMYLRLDPGMVAKEIITSLDSDQDGCISMEEFLVWTVNNALCEDFLDLLSQICHVLLGLKPTSPEEEGKIILDWLAREERKKKKVGQVWYLISMQWWCSWSSYVTHDKHLEENGAVLAIELDQQRNWHDSKPNMLTQCRNQTSCLGWDSDSMTMINVNKSMEIRETPIVVGDSREHSNHFSPTFPRTSHSVTSSPRKYRLSPETETRSASQGGSPRIKKRTLQHQKPGQIDNSSLVMPSLYKVMTLTNEGGRLKRDVMMVDGTDFKLVSEPVWKALSTWYGGSPALPRTVIPGIGGEVMAELELYPVLVRLYRHQLQVQRPVQTTSFTSMMSGIGGMAINTVSTLTNHVQQPRRILSFTACFSRCHTIQQIYEFLCNKLKLARDDVRLWKINPNDESIMSLLDDEAMTVDQAGVEDSQQILIEVRNKDLTWPEEMSQLAKNKRITNDKAPTEPGATGLNNLGNTCFMNAAVQCVSNTNPLTQYFTRGLHLYEINRTNPLGMKGHIAQRYGDLVKDMWSGTTRTTAPLKLRWTIGKYAPRFNGFQQHDSQELLSFLLDGLHEDLNRVQDKPYVELKDSDGRPDEIVAQEAWENHLLRNQSVIVDLFHGQLKSQVRCKECCHISVRFDPFNYLSLPLPMESCIHLEIIVMRLNGEVPVKYGLRLNMDDKYKVLKKELSSLCDIPIYQLLLVEISGPVVKTLPQDNQKIRNLVGTLYAYELCSEEKIEPISQDEELAEKKSCVGLSEIQRGVTSTASPKKPIANGTILRLQKEPLSLNGELLNGSPSSTPSHSRNNSSTSLNISINGSSSTESHLPKSVGDVFNGFVIAVHRKMTLMDLYFLSTQKTRPSLFGTPIILPCDEKSTNQELYGFIWHQVARIVSPLPPSEARLSNHALDCDDSLGYEYPFTLKVVQKDGFTCAWCPWYRFCRGCSLECNSETFNFGSSFIAIDWEPTALHLRYQTSCERFVEDHASVAESRTRQSEPIDLDTCLRAFTKEEELGDEELYYCSKCKKHCLAAKKLDIWRLPPVLIVNLKRFQFLNGRWVKSHKIVNFPLLDFDPSCYLAPRKHSICNCGPPGNEQEHPSNNIENGHHGDGPEHSKTEDCSIGINCDKKMDSSTRDGTDVMTTSNSSLDSSKATSSECSHMEPTSLSEWATSQSMSTSEHVANQSSNTAGNIQCNNNATCSPMDSQPAKYDLFSMSCHTGILGGGHYVAFARNPNGKWYCYNDSSCKEVKESQLDSNAAYILFYQRKDIDPATFLPEVAGKSPDMQEIDDEFESDFKKMCVIQ